jgi:DNA processing protein
LLRAIPDPPTCLYWQGELSCLDAPAVAVVGARRCSSAGAELARSIAKSLAHSGVVVVSGLAAGIDGAAHRGALDAGGGTVAVLGHGLGTIYPAAHHELARRIVDCGGALLSEYARDVGPARWRFPERNRLISGLVRAVVIVEASARSGSLITARMALEQGRDVLVTPGAAGSLRHAGSHRMIREGAALVDGPDHVLLELGIERPPVAVRLSGDLEGVFGALDVTPMAADAVALKLGRDIGDVVAALVQLELMGIVRQVSDGYIRVPS